VNLKVKYADFQIVTRARSLDRPVSGEAEFLAMGAELLRGLLPPVKSIRLLGLGLSSLGEEERRPPRPPELELPWFETPLPAGEREGPAAAGGGRVRACSQAMPSPWRASLACPSPPSGRGVS
jgi:hypothetical protein